MYLLQFIGNEGVQLGIRTEQGVIDMTAALDVFYDFDLPVDLATIFQDTERNLETLSVFVQAALDVASKWAAMGDEEGLPHWLLDEKTLTYAPPITAPEKIICVGKNYRLHAAETGSEIPASPILFSKFNNALTGAGAAVPMPTESTMIDYEAELAVIIGKEGKHILQSDALNHVFGYTIANDLSARDLQKRTSQWLIGKSLDQFLPLGPYIVTQDAISNPQGLDIKCWVNGELRQNSNTANMLFPVAQVISYASQIMTLKPGDVILTGTPEGVGMGMSPPRWLKPNDAIKIHITGLGELNHTITKPQI